MVRKKLGRGRKNRCRFCTKEGCPRPAFVDYKDVQGLKKMCTSQGKVWCDLGTDQTQSFDLLGWGVEAKGDGRKLPP